MRRLGVKQRLDPFRRQERERPIAIRGAEALKDAAPHPLRAWAFRGEELLRVEILGDDGGHATRLDAPRADGGARTAHRRLVCRHEARRPRQAGKLHERIAASAEIAMRATIAIDPRLHVFRELHCFVTLRSASHGLLASVASTLPKCSVTPSGVVMLVTFLPLRSAAAITLEARPAPPLLGDFWGDGRFRHVTKFPDRKHGPAALTLARRHEADRQRIGW